MNVYGFVKNDSQNLIDPIGLDFIAVGIRPLGGILGLFFDHLSIEFYEEGACARTPEGHRFSDWGPDEAFELLVETTTYRHFFWIRPKPTADPVRTFVWDYVSYIQSSSSANDHMVIYSQVDAEQRWNDIEHAARNYRYAEQLPLPVNIQNWPDSKYQFPWENPGNNSNTFVREMARLVGRNADVIGGNTPGAQVAAPVPDPGYVPVYSPW